MQAHGHSPDCVLLVTVDTSGVEMLVSVGEAGEVLEVVVLGASVVVIIGWTGVVVVWTGVVVAEVVVLGTVKES